MDNNNYSLSIKSNNDFGIYGDLEVLLLLLEQEDYNPKSFYTKVRSVFPRDLASTLINTLSPELIESLKGF